MQLDGSAITIERRKITGCIDLAVVFVREHFGAVATMTAFFAVPSTLLTWWLMAYTDQSLFVSLILFALLSPILGAVLVIGAGRRVFGDEFRVGESFSALRKRFWRLFGYMLLTRVLGGVLWCLILPPLLVVVHSGFIAEILYLESTPGNKVAARRKSLMTNVFSDLVGRGLAVFAFYALVVFGLFLLLERAAALLTGLQIMGMDFTAFIGLMFEDGEEFLTVIIAHPLFITVLHALMWLVYPLIRLAWFFCYLDVRIQKEGWDVELDFRIEAQRLGKLA
jgi:hypothetical protein